MNHSNRLYSMVATVLILIGLPFLGMGCRNFWLAFTSPGWPIAPGNIRSSEVEEYLTGTSTSRTRTRSSSASIVFEYRADGQNYTSDTVYLGRSAGSADSSEAEMLHLRYPQSAAVKVYYDRANPSTAVLESGVFSDAYWIPSMGAFLLLAGLAIGLFAIPTLARSNAAPIAAEAQEWLRRMRETGKQMKPGQLSVEGIWQEKR